MKHSGIRFLLPYMAPYRRHLVIGTIYALISATASAFSPALLGRAIDDVLAGIRAISWCGTLSGLSHWQPRSPCSGICSVC